MNYYSVLGVDKTASQDDIKKAYRRLAMKYHPDRGGSDEKFAQINQAYDVLKDPNTRYQYDNPQSASSNNAAHNMHDVFNNFFNMHKRAQRKNSDLGITVKITLEEVMTGKDMLGRYYLSDGTEKIANIHIPAGIENGTIMRFRGMGDNIIKGIPSGDLHVQIIVIQHKNFTRDRLHLKTRYNVNVFDLITGKTILVKDLENKNISINIPPGTDPGTILSVSSHGLVDESTGRRGNLYVELKGKTPKLDKEQIEKVIKTYDEISVSP